MSRFQAQTSTVLDEELELLREEMGLREHQKAELLREMAAIASWVFTQARAGRVVEARGPDGTERLHHAALRPRRGLEPVVLAEAEAERLIALLDSDRWPNVAAEETFRRLAAQGREPPSIRWPDAVKG